MHDAGMTSSAAPGVYPNTGKGIGKSSENFRLSSSGATNPATGTQRDGVSRSTSRGQKRSQKSSVTASPEAGTSRTAAQCRLKSIATTTLGLARSLSCNSPRSAETSAVGGFQSTPLFAGSRKEHSSHGRAWSNSAPPLCRENGIRGPTPRSAPHSSGMISLLEQNTWAPP